jgi:hypothetical protein
MQCDTGKDRHMADKWHVVSQVQDTELSEHGPGFETIWKVTYQVDNGPAAGTRGVVKVPAAQYGKDVVAKAIDAAVYHLDQIAAL